MKSWQYIINWCMVQFVTTFWPKNKFLLWCENVKSYNFYIVENTVAERSRFAFVIQLNMSVSGYD